MLKFVNYSGPGVTSRHITSFIKYANDATSLYKDNIAANLNYIKQMMDINFGSVTNNFLVMIQTKQTASSFFVWIDEDQLYASLSRINKLYPEWSYLFVKVDVVEIGPDYVIITEGTEGKGVTEDIDNILTRAIDRYEKTSGLTCPCDQNALLEIGYAINIFDNWSSICGNPGLTNSYVNAVKGMWINKRRGSCEYTFYVHK